MPSSGRRSRTASRRCGRPHAGRRRAPSTQYSSNPANRNAKKLTSSASALSISSRPKATMSTATRSASPRSTSAIPGATLAWAPCCCRLRSPVGSQLTRRPCAAERAFRGAEPDTGRDHGPDLRGRTFPERYGRRVACAGAGRARLPELRRARPPARRRRARSPGGGARSRQGRTRTSTRGGAPAGRSARRGPGPSPRATGGRCRPRDRPASSSASVFATADTIFTPFAPLSSQHLGDVLDATLRAAHEPHLGARRQGRDLVDELHVARARRSSRPPAPGRRHRPAPRRRGTSSSRRGRSGSGRGARGAPRAARPSPRSGRGTPR